MEVRDDQDQLRTILQNLRIGISDGGSNASTSSPPSLPLTDQLRLLSAHIDTIKTNIAELTLSDKGINQIRQQSQSALQVKKRITDIEEKIERLENDQSFSSTSNGIHEKGVDQLREDFNRSITAYLSVRQSFENKKELNKLAKVIHEAVLALELLEDKILSSQFEANELKEAITQATEKCSRLGVRPKDSDQISPNEDEFAWLGRGSSAAPIVQQLQRKLDLLTSQADDVLKKSWDHCIHFSLSEEEGNVELAVSSQSKVKLGDKEIQLQLSTIMQTLQDRSELLPLLQTFCRKILSDIIKPLLQVKEDGKPVSGWQTSISDDVWRASKVATAEKDKFTLDSIVSLFNYLKEHIFNNSIAKGPLSDIQFEFARLVIPAMIPLLISFLKNQFPETLEKPIQEKTKGTLQEIAKEAIRVYEVLSENGYLTGGLEEEGKDLLEFAQNISKYFLKHLATTSRFKARNLLLKVMNGGWEGVQIEMDVEILQLAPSPQAQDLPPQSSKPMNSLEFNGVGEDEDWSTWDEAGAERENAESRPTRKTELEPHHNPLRTSTPLSQRSASPASLTSNKAKQKKSALGGVRVIKPQDQLGSGPFPRGSMDEELDESSWGFDENEQQPITHSANASISSSSHQSTISNPHKLSIASLLDIADDDEDAWFQDDLGNANTSNASCVPPVPSSVASISQTLPADDEEDAWFQEDEKDLQGSLDQPQHNTTHLATALPDTALIEDDAWFQEDDHAKQAVTNDSTDQQKHTVENLKSSASHTVAVGDDAWFQEDDKNTKSKDINEHKKDQNQEHLAPNTSLPSPAQDDAWFQDDETNTRIATQEALEQPEHTLSHSAISISQSSLSEEVGKRTNIDNNEIKTQQQHDIQQLPSESNETKPQDDAWFQEEVMIPKQNDITNNQTQTSDIPSQSSIPAPAAEEDSWFQDDMPTTTSGQDDIPVYQHTSTSPAPDTGDTALVKEVSHSSAIVEEQPEALPEAVNLPFTAQSQVTKPSESDNALAPVEPAIAVETEKSISHHGEEKRQAPGSGNSQSSSNDDASWLHEDISSSMVAQSQNASNASLMKKVQPLNETISQSSSLSSPAMIDHVDLDEDIDEDAWGLTEEEKVERAAKRASMRASRGGPDLANAFKAFTAEKENVEGINTKDGTTGPSTKALIDLTEEDEEEPDNMKAIENIPKEANDTIVTSTSIPSVVIQPTTQKETCMISQRSMEFMKLVSSMLDDIISIEQENDKISEGLEVKYLIDALNDVLDLHRALMPVGHAETLNNVPTLAAQFFNDCTYIGRELIKLDEIWQEVCKSGSNDSTLEDQKDLLSKHAKLTILLGQRSFDAQILVQQRILSECLIDSNGFIGTFEEQRFQLAKRSIGQIMIVLQQLHSSWKSVFTFSTHQIVMGKLIDSVLKRVLRDITSLEDISEVEGEKLSELMKSFGELENIFRTKEQQNQTQTQTEEQTHSDVAIYVPNWFKASYLSDILTGSLVDIEFLYFEAGALVDYTKEELTNLIRALFSDTPKRSKLIERIQSSSNV